MTIATDIDQLCINTIRVLSADAVQKANSGHPGLPMGAAVLGYVLWTRHLSYVARILGLLGGAGDPTALTGMTVRLVK